jgi:hypothetical protein
MKLVILVAIAAASWSSCESRCNCGGPDDLRTIRGATYQHDYPPSLDSMVDDFERRGLNVDGASKWRTFYYIANVRKDDPPELPIAMNAPHHKNGHVLFKDGLILPFHHLIESRKVTPADLLKEPSIFVRDKLSSKEEYEELKKRLKVLPPSNRCLETLGTGC